jgi:serralysin
MALITSLPLLGGILNPVTTPLTSVVVDTLDSVNNVVQTSAGVLVTPTATDSGQKVALVTGTNGDDYILGSPNDDTIGGGQGADMIDAGAGHDYVYGGIGNDTIAGSDGNDHLYGNTDDAGDDGADRIDGGSGNDYVQGNAGADLLTGGSGNDRINGGRDNDTIFGDDGADTANGNRGDDQIAGGFGNDTLRGGQDNDRIDGGADNDHLYGDRGYDTITGGSGADVFHFAGGDAPVLSLTGLLGGNETVTDFTDGEDRFALDFVVRETIDGGVQATVAGALSVVQQLLVGQSSTVATVQVGADTYLFYNSEGLVAGNMIQLQNVDSQDISTADFV